MLHQRSNQRGSSRLAQPRRPGKVAHRNPRRRVFRQPVQRLECLCGLPAHVHARIVQQRHDGRRRFGLAARRQALQRRIPQLGVGGLQLFEQQAGLLGAFVGSHAGDDLGARQPPRVSGFGEPGLDPDRDPTKRGQGLPRRLSHVRVGITQRADQRVDRLGIADRSQRHRRLAPNLGLRGLELCDQQLRVSQLRARQRGRGCQPYRRVLIALSRVGQDLHRRRMAQVTERGRGSDAYTVKRILGQQPHQTVRGITVTQPSDRPRRHGPHLVREIVQAQRHRFAGHRAHALQRPDDLYSPVHAVRVGVLVADHPRHQRDRRHADLHQRVPVALGQRDQAGAHRVTRLPSDGVQRCRRRRAHVAEHVSERRHQHVLRALDVAVADRTRRRRSHRRLRIVLHRLQQRLSAGLTLDVGQRVGRLQSRRVAEVRRQHLGQRAVRRVGDRSQRPERPRRDCPRLGCRAAQSADQYLPPGLAQSGERCRGGISSVRLIIGQQRLQRRRRQRGLEPPKRYGCRHAYCC